MKRLTVHLANVKKIQLETNKFVYQHKGRTYKDSMEAPKEAKRIKEKKTKTFTTLSFYCKTKEACIQKLSEVRSKYTIAKGTDYKKKHKYDKELFNISWVN